MLIQAYNVRIFTNAKKELQLRCPKKKKHKINCNRFQFKVSNMRKEPPKFYKTIPIYL